MTLTVGADTHVTLVEYAAYAASLGWVLASEDAANEANLRRGLQFIERGRDFLGSQDDAAQALAFPRNGVTPTAIKEAQMESAYAVQNGFDPFPVLDRSVKSARDKVGPLDEQVEYFGGEGVKSLPAVDMLLKPYLASSGSKIALRRA